MAIVFNCDCGRELRAKDDWAGKKTHCPSCNATLFIPKPKSAEPEPAEPKTTKNPLDEAIPVDFSIPATGGSQPTVSTAAPPSALIQADRSPSTDDPGLVPEDADDNHSPAAGTRVYKVLTPKDYGIAAKFNAESLEKTLNDFAKKGWSLKSTAVMSVATHSGPHDEIILFLEK